MSLVSFMTFVREAREGQDQVNAYLSNIHENCKVGCNLPDHTQYMSHSLNS